jgi:outer membrane protein TolC
MALMPTWDGTRMNGKQGRVVVCLMLALLASAPVVLHAQPARAPETPLPVPRAAGTAIAPLSQIAIPGIPDRAVPITFPAALQLAELANLDIAQAREVVNQAIAVRTRGLAMTLPNIQTGASYNHHEGQIQKTEGNIITVNRDSLWVNSGPVVSYQLVEAIFTPMIATRLLDASRAGQRRVSNDTFLAVADAYFAVLRARRRIARIEETMEFLTSEQPSALRSKSRGLLPLMEDFVRVGGREALRSELERVRVEVRRRQEEMASAVIDLRVASAELSRLLHLDPEIILMPVEDFRFPLQLPADQWMNQSLEQLVSVAMANRPELAENQALVAAALGRVRTAKWRPLMPTLAVGYNIGGFGGGPSIVGPTIVPGSNPPTFVNQTGNGSSGHIDNFKSRSEFDAAIVWSLRNLGVGNYAEIKEQEAAHRRLQYAQIQWADRVIAQVVQAQAAVEGWRSRLDITRASLFGPNYELSGPVFESIRLSFERVRGGEGRPLETLDSIRSLSDLLDAYNSAATDYERARFRLMVALGMPPAQIVASPSGPAPQAPAPAPQAPMPQGPAPAPAVPPAPAPQAVVPPAATPQAPLAPTPAAPVTAVPTPAPQTPPAPPPATGWFAPTASTGTPSPSASPTASATPALPVSWPAPFNNP